MRRAFSGIFEGLTVLVTGHTGFQGSWLSLWLQELGARTVGFALPPAKQSHYLISRVEEGMIDNRGNICDLDALKRIINEYHPTVVFHLAELAAPGQAFENPKTTFDVNVGGTVNILEAVRHSPAVKAVVVASSAACYENKEWIWGYREDDALGGYSSYGASKSMAEQAVAAYRRSFFQQAVHPVVVATARAGTLIGGGDLTDFHLSWDCMRSLMSRQPISVNNPYHVRPWMSVFDALSGYLWLAARLLSTGQPFAHAWNIGPAEQRPVEVRSFVEKAINVWGSGSWVHEDSSAYTPEVRLLRLNSDKAFTDLRWRPAYSWVDGLKETVEWFKHYDKYRRSPSSVDMRQLSLSHLYAYRKQAHQLNFPWVGVGARDFSEKR